MLISTPHKLAFIHIPKTGGSSITAALAPYLDEPKEVVGAKENARGWQMKHHRGHMHDPAKKAQPPNGFTVAAIIRNPFDRMASMWWRYRDEDEPLSSFITRVKEGKVTQAMRKRWVHPQRWWLVGFEERLTLGRFEDIDEGFCRICASVGLPSIPLPHVNTQAPKSPWPTYYDAGTQSQVASLWETDFTTYNYSTDIPRP